MTGWGPYLECRHGRRAVGTGTMAGIAMVMVLGAGVPAVRPGSAGHLGRPRLAVSRAG